MPCTPSLGIKNTVNLKSLFCRNYAFKQRFDSYTFKKFWREFHFKNNNTTVMHTDMKAFIPIFHL